MNHAAVFSDPPNFRKQHTTTLELPSYPVYDFPNTEINFVMALFYREPISSFLVKHS